MQRTTPFRALSLAILGVLLTTTGMAGADDGSLQEAFALARHALHGQRSISDRQLDQSVFARVEAAAQRGEVEAMWYAGSLQAVGIGTALQPESAVAWITGAADLKHPAAAYWMAAYYRGIANTGRDPVFRREAAQEVASHAVARYVQYLTTAALAGHVGAMNELVARYDASGANSWPLAAEFWSKTAQEHRGRIVPVDPVPDWIRAAATPVAVQPSTAGRTQPPAVGQVPVYEPATPATASTSVRRQERELQETRQRLADAERRIELLEAAVTSAERTIPHPMGYLEAHGALPPVTAEDELNRRGLDLYEGRNYQDAAILFGMAADRGDAAAQANLGMMYLHGMGVEQSAYLAIRYLRMASRAGNVTATENLGLIYANGLNGAVDLRRARKWLMLALEQGSAMAPRALVQLESVAGHRK